MSRPSPRAVWGAILGGGVAYEVYALRWNLDAALSRITRGVFRVDTLPGRVAFTVTWLGFTGWFHKHILTPVTPDESAE